MLDSANEMINFDANASLGLMPQIREQLLQVNLGLNPSSPHRSGQLGKGIIENTRDIILKYLGCGDQYHVTFTSGATESNNAALMQLILDRGRFSEPPILVVSPVEHPSVLSITERLASMGVEIKFPSVAKTGLINTDSMVNIAKGASMMSLQLANNEVPTLQPIFSITKEIKRETPRTVIHSDFVQGIGKLQLLLEGSDIDIVSVSGHKLGALTGIGAIIHKKSLGIEPLLVGGAQEKKFRSGTENVIGIFSFGAAIKIWESRGDEFRKKIRNTKDYIKSILTSKIQDLIFNGEGSIDSSLSITLPGVRADDLVIAADISGVAISSGAACSSGNPRPSHVLVAMGLSEDEAKSTVRLSFDPLLSDSMIESGANRLISAIKGLRR